MKIRIDELFYLSQNRTYNDTDRLIGFELELPLFIHYLIEVKKMGFGSKYFGWLASFGIVLALSWFLLPEGWNTVVQVFAPHFGNYIRPTVALLNILIVNPLSNLLAVGIWAAAGFVGGVIAGTKKGAFVVALVTWISSQMLLMFYVYMLFTSGVNLGTIPTMPPGASIIDILSIPLVKDLIGVVLNTVGAAGSGGPDIVAIILPVVVYVFVPVIIAVIAGIIGATIRPKE